jgi:hypothetical protein
MDVISTKIVMRNKQIVLMDGDVALTWIACMLREMISGVLLYSYI